MGIMHFLLPEDSTPEALRELERASVAGGPDNMPTHTELTIAENQLTTARMSDESGYLVAPRDVPGHGRLMGTTATLMERKRPYSLLVELARGKVNQMRSQAADWKTGGLVMSQALQDTVTSAARAFGRAVTTDSLAESDKLAEEALALGYTAAQQLVGAYVEQVFHIRHQRTPKLDSQLSCRLTIHDAEHLPDLFPTVKQTFTSVSLPFSWCDIEQEQGVYSWDHWDSLLQDVTAQGIPVTGGPLIDFSSIQLPPWLWTFERDVPNLATFMCRFVETTLRRYKQRIRRWQLAAGSNCATVLGLSEEELLGITYKLADVARQIDPTIEVVLGIAQPWGEYLTAGTHITSPFSFADNIIRSPLNNLTALDVELVMGVDPRGSYCRDVLEVSRLLDLYALLGLPLRLTLGFPASDEADADADPEMRVGSGMWRGACSPENQAAWATTFGQLVLCKPYVQSIQWVQLCDSVAHQFPHAGLIDPNNRPRPALESLHQLRRRHLQ